MTGRNAPEDRDRYVDILVERATQGLESASEADLERLRAEHPDVREDELELSAAAVFLAFQALEETEEEPLPDHVRSRVRETAEQKLPIPFRARDSRVEADQVPSTGSGGSLVSRAGWFVAAAMLIVAVVAGLSGRVPETPVPTPGPAELRQRLLADGQDTLRIAWSVPEIEAYRSVRGDVVWSRSSQTGFMLLSGLPANDPEEAQYQLWIVDPNRDTRPVDGGVFDIPAGSDEVLIPIDAKLRVDTPAAFAITLEKPGGVVVSAGPLLVVAPVDA